MKKPRIHTPKPQSTNLFTLPHHERAARRARAKTERPSVSRKRPHSRNSARPADFRTNPLLFGQ